MYIRNPGHMTKMAAMTIYGKNNENLPRFVKVKVGNDQEMEKARWEKTKLTIRYLKHRKPNEQLFSQ